MFVCLLAEVPDRCSENSVERWHGPQRRPLDFSGNPDHITKDNAWDRVSVMVSGRGVIPCMTWEDMQASGPEIKRITQIRPWRSFELSALIYSPVIVRSLLHTDQDAAHRASTFRFRIQFRRCCLCRNNNNNNCGCGCRRSCGRRPYHCHRPRLLLRTAIQVYVSPSSYTSGAQTPARGPKTARDESRSGPQRPTGMKNIAFRSLPNCRISISDVNRSQITEAKAETLRPRPRSRPEPRGRGQDRDQVFKTDAKAEATCSDDVDRPISE